MNEKIDEIKKRVLQYQMGELPGQPMITHMGTSYLIGDMERIIDDLQAENARLKKRIHDILLVDTTDGMTASEWVDRTAKAEAENARLTAEHEQLENAIKVAIVVEGELKSELAVALAENARLREACKIALEFPQYKDVKNALENALKAIGE